MVPYTVLLFSTGGAAIMTYIIVALMKVITSDFTLFLAMDFLLNVFIGIQYLAMDTFKGELWPTERRGTFISLVRLISIGSLIPETLWAVTAPLSQFLMLNIAAIAWFLRGIETSKGVSITLTSGEVIQR